MVLPRAADAVPACGCQQVLVLDPEREPEFYGKARAVYTGELAPDPARAANNFFYRPLFDNGDGR